MKVLENVIAKNGGTYKKVLRKNDVAMYARSTDGETITSYEVFLVKTQESCVLNGYEYPATERFPSNETFGKTAWSWGSKFKDKAEKQFNDLLKQSKPKIHKLEDYEISYFPLSGSLYVKENGEFVEDPNSILIAAYMLKHNIEDFEQVENLSISEIRSGLFENKSKV